MRITRFLFFCFLLPLLLISAAAGYWITRQNVQVAIDSSAQRLLASDPRNLETFEKLGELIPETEMVLVALKLDNLFSNQGAETLIRASNQMMSVPGAVEVKSLTHSYRPVRNGFQLDYIPFMPGRATPDQWREIRNFVTQFPLSRNVLVSGDARYAILLGEYERILPDHQARENFRLEFMAAMEPLRTETEALHVLAFPFVEAEGVNAVKSDLHRYLIAAGVLIVLVLLLTFRSLVALLTVLTLEGFGVLILFATFRFFNRPVDLYSGILFPLVGGLQLTFVIHYLSALQAAGRKMPPLPAARAAFREVFPPSCIAALTTIIGLLTLAFSQLSTLTDFGRIGAAAVAGVFVFTFLIPLLFAFGPLPAAASNPPEVPEKSAPAIRWSYAFLLLAISYGLVMAFGIFKVRTDIRAVEFIEPGHPVRESMELLNTELGGTNIFQLEVDSGKARGLQTLPVLTYLENLRAYAKTLEGVTDAYAYSQLYLGLNQIWDGDPDPNGKLPDNPAKLTLFSNLINASPLLYKDSFVDAQSRASLLILRSRDMPGKTYLKLLEDFTAYAKETAPPGVSVEPVNGLHTILKGDRDIVMHQLITLGVTVLIIGGLLSLLWLSPKLSGMILLANTPALLTIFGIMGYSGYPMNSITIMVAAVILGIAVDDGIHLVSAFRHLRRQGLSSAEAATLALRRKLKPMACTSSILAVFLGLLMLTSFPPVAHFGILSAFGILAAFLGAIILLPGMLQYKK